MPEVPPALPQGSLVPLHDEPRARRGAAGEETSRARATHAPGEGHATGRVRGDVPLSHDELVALLRSSQDFIPLPETWTGALQRRSVAPGPAPFRLIECPRCDGRGNLRSGWPCSDCEGRGRYAVDGYTEEIVSASKASWADVLSATVNCWKCGGWGRLGAHAETRPDPRTAPLCPECEGSGKEPAPVGGRIAHDVDERTPRQGDRTLDALDAQHKRRDDLRCYQQLGVAMDELREHEPGLAFLVTWIYVLEAQTPSPGNAAALERGLAFLLARMGDVRAPASIRNQAANRAAALVRAKGKSADRKAQQLRNEQIRRLRDAGAKLAELAADFDLDKAQISRITRSDT